MMALAPAGTDPVHHTDRVSRRNPQTGTQTILSRFMLADGPEPTNGDIVTLM